MKFDKIIWRIFRGLEETSIMLREEGAKHIVGSLWEHEEAHSFYGSSRINGAFYLIVTDDHFHTLWKYIDHERGHWVASPSDIEKIREKGLI